MRAFIAIAVPDDIKEFALNTKTRLDAVSPDIKWVEYANYHLTLKFLGEINSELSEKIVWNLFSAGESCPPFALCVEGLGFFPNKRRPRVVWLGIKGEMEKAHFLGERIDAYLSPLDFEVEKKRSFHFTLGRIRSSKHLDEFMNKAVVINKELQSRSFLVEEFYLMESQLSSHGPSYRMIQSFRLNG
jgi:2'-5' RNA ligase